MSGGSTRSQDPRQHRVPRHPVIGKTGIERFYEAELHGQVGYEEVETNAQGRVMRVLNHDPIPGRTSS
jgi:cell division protein FtsI/penicillin-binding protein 2